MAITEKFIGQLQSVVDGVSLYLDVHSPAPVSRWFDLVIVSLEPHLREGSYPPSELLVKAGNVEFGRGKRERALQFFAFAMKQSEQEQNIDVTAAVYINLAHLYIAEEKFDLALKVAEQSVALATEHGMPAAQVSGLLAAGLALKRMPHLPRSHRMFASACQKASEHGLSDLEIRSLMHLSWFDYQSGQLEDATLKLRRALDLCAITGNTVDQLRAYFNLGLVQADDGDLSGALRSLVRAKDIRDSHNLQYGDLKIEHAIEAVEKDLQATGPES